MNRLAEILKRHIWCVITIATTILLAIITLSFGKDVNLVSHLSLTSAVVSIVLAVIVTVYVYFQDQRSSQNITEMRKLIDHVFLPIFNKTASKKKILTVQGDFDKIIDVVRTESFF